MGILYFNTLSFAVSCDWNRVHWQKTTETKDKKYVNFNVFFQLLTIYKCILFSVVCGCVHGIAGISEGQGTLDCLGCSFRQLWAICPKCVLREELRCSVRAVCTLNCWAISPTFLMDFGCSSLVFKDSIRKMCK